MKKSISALLILMSVAVSCNKKNDTAAKPNIIPQTNVAELVAKINTIGDNFKNKHATTAHKTTNKKGMMMLGDAIGGVLGAGGGPFGALWGGFGISMMVGSYMNVVITNPTNPSPNTTGSGSFIYGYLGDDHNALLCAAFTNSVTVSVNNNNQYNTSTVNLLTSSSNNFSNIDGGKDNTFSLLSNNQTMLGGQYNYANSVINDDNFCSEVLSEYISDANENDVTESIITGIENDISSESDCNQYLLQVQSTILQSQDLTPAEKNAAYIFLGICNSSMYFWDANGYSYFQ